MENFYEPDTRWDMYQINDQKQFAEKVVIEGYFHRGVPDDIKEAYTTVKYLMAHSYYYWPMFDEAFNKVLLTIEMGIKLRAQQLNIPTFRRKENGKRWERSLSKIINDICEEEYLHDLKQKLDRSRELRNMQVHPKQNAFSGPAGGIDRNIRYCVNVLNRLFRNKEWHLKQQKKIKKIEKVFDQFKNELLVIESKKKAKLVSSILDFELIGTTLFISYLPVLDVRKLKADGKDDTSPRVGNYIIKDYKLYKNHIEGRTLSGININISVTDHSEAIRAFKKQQKYLGKIPDDKKKAYFYLNNQESGWQLSEAEYQFMAEYNQ